MNNTVRVTKNKKQKGYSIFIPSGVASEARISEGTTVYVTAEAPGILSVVTPSAPADWNRFQIAGQKGGKARARNAAKKAREAARART